MTFRLDLRTRTTGPHTTLIDGLCHVCGWCGQRFATARELVAHVAERRAAA